MRALIVSDIHGNFEALKAVLAAAEPYDVLWNLGDVVGYGGSPNDVIDLIRVKAEVNVRGNHDRVCAGLSSAQGFNPVARAAAMWTNRELSPENLEWLKAVPAGPVKPSMDGVMCVHGSPLNEDQYILNMRDAWAPLQQMGTAITFFGHTHLQGGFSQKAHDWYEIKPQYVSKNGAACWKLELGEGTRHLINPGAVGQPRDCDWRAAFVVYDSEAKVIEYHRVPYDLQAAQGRILMAGLPERLAGRLREGR
jgi:predicted phosphodiesterase